jgi:hypothetical protein
MKLISSYLIILVIFSSCEINGFKTIRGNGIWRSESRSISDFTSLDVSGPFDVIVTQDPNETLRIETDANLHPYIEVKNQNGKLRISTRNGYNIRSRKRIEIFISGPVFGRISLNGSGSLRSKGRIKSNNIDVNIAGSGEVVMELDAPLVKTEISGSGSARLSGETESFESRINGSGEVYAFNLLSENTKVKISGSGEAEVYASKQLEISIAGSGDVGYKGNPSVKQSVAGSGDIRKVN